MSKSTLNKINLILFSLILIIIISVLALPQIPRIELLLSNIRQKKIELPENSALLQLDQKNVSVEDDNKITKRDNSLILPSIFLDSKILGGDIDNLNKGIWHRQFSGNPIDGGNMVLIAHRYQFTTGNNTFYHLDKVKTGDYLAVYWENQEYVYKVSDVFIVNPDEVYIEEQTNEHILTLYTCTPLWTAEKRLVVRANPIEQN